MRADGGAGGGCGAVEGWEGPQHTKKPAALLVAQYAELGVSEFVFLHHTLEWGVRHKTHPCPGNAADCAPPEPADAGWPLPLVATHVGNGG